MHRRIIAATLLLLAASLLLAGCGRSKASEEPIAIRTPLPTFTPTPPPGSATGSSASLSAPEYSAQAFEDTVQVDIEPSVTPGIGGPVAAVEPKAPTALSDAATATQPNTPQAIEAVVDAPLAVVNTELVNARSGPDTTYDVVVVLGRGEEYDVTAKSGDGSWFRICCTLEGAEAWVKSEFVDTDGATDPLPVAQAGEVSGNALATLTATAAPVQVAEAPTVEPTATPQAAAVAQPTPTDTPAPVAPQPAAEPAPTVNTDVVAAAGASAALELVAQEKFPETNVVRVFLYVYSESEALEGFSLRVTKDGVELAAAGQSFGGRPGLTWPIADDRQRFQNLKVEFPGQDPAGTWSVEPMKDGAPAGPAATFTLAAGEPNRELYVRYKRP